MLSNMIPPSILSDWDGIACLELEAVHCLERNCRVVKTKFFVLDN